MKNNPMLFTIGRALFAKRTVAQQAHVTIKYPMKMCHLCGMYSGRYSPYMATAIWLLILAIVAISCQLAYE
jgi:hypothetical protein